MSITILSPYRLFFIDESDFLFALMKDGRISRVKKVDAFAALSADFKHIGGVSFDGENTHISLCSLDFDNQPCDEMMAIFGYFYFPAFSAKNKKMAVIEADLLNPRPAGELSLYQRKIKKWKKIMQTSARMKPPVWSKHSDSLFYLDEKNSLLELRETRTEVKAENVIYFALSPLQTELAYFDGSHIHLYSLLEKKELELFAASYTTALCFDQGAENIFYATTVEGRNAIYAFNRRTQKIGMLCEIPSGVVFLSA